MSTRLIIIGAATLIVVAAVIGWFVSHSPTPPAPVTELPQPTPPKQLKESGEPFSTTSQQQRLAYDFEPIPAEAQEQLDQMNSFLDEREDDQALPIVRKLLRSPNPEVRSQAIFAARWIGKETIPDLMDVLPDADEEGLRQLLEALPDLIGEGTDGAEPGEDDYAGERAQAKQIEDMILFAAKNPLVTIEVLEPLFNSFGPLPPFITLPILEKLVKHPNPIVSTIAGDAFTFNSGGYPWVSAAETKRLADEDRASRE